MTYTHEWDTGKPVGLPVGKVVCVGRNYAAHAAELNNPVPKAPLLFIKPATSVVSIYEPVVIPRDKGMIHFETEIALLIGKTLTNVEAHEAMNGIIGMGAALDLTARDLQDQLKKKGHPWEKAKAFDGSCPLSRFEPIDRFGSLDDIKIELAVSGEIRQKGSSAQMLFGILPLVQYISGHFTLTPGDVVLTGTPEGVGPLNTGDRLTIKLNNADIANTLVAAT